MPSCYGKADNYYPALNQEMTSDYIICKDQRVMGSGSCSNGHVFDIRALTCTDIVYPVSLNDFCTKHRMGRVQNPRNCAQYYDCAVSMSDIAECQYPDLYDTTSHLCLPYSQVNCAGRPVFLEPCDSFTFCPVQPCPYCNSAYPSCVGRNGATGGFRFEPSMYYKCEHDRLMLKYCQTTFNWTARTCDEVISPVPQLSTIASTRRLEDTTTAYTTRPSDPFSRLCQDNPGKLLPHPQLCTKFIRCAPGAISSETYTIGECPYPLLFSNGLCSSYKTTNCGTRAIGKAPCDYEELRKCPDKVNRCRVTTADTCPDNQEHFCTPCEQRFPSCVDKPNGLVHYPGRFFTPDFINCDQHRTLSILKCVGSIFDPDARRCGLNLDIVVTEAEKRTVSFCSKYKGALVPHPRNCAWFYNCSAEADLPGVEGTPHLQECLYPKLFDRSLRICDNFINVLNTAGCEERFQPKHFCDYIHACPSERFSTCKECRKSMPSCEDKVNGIHGNPPGRDVTNGFMYCVEGRVLTTSLCPLGSAFYESTKSCLLPLTTLGPNHD